MKLLFVVKLEWERKYKESKLFLRTVRFSLVSNFLQYDKTFLSFLPYTPKRGMCCDIPKESKSSFGRCHWLQFASLLL